MPRPAGTFATPLSRYAICLAGLVALILAGRYLLTLNAATEALLMLLVVLAAATKFGLAEAIVTSVAAVLGFNYFFLPPVGTFTIADPENWVALAAFLATAVTVSQLSATARRRTEEAVAGRNDLLKLFELSRAMLMDEARDAVRMTVIKAAQVLSLRHMAFHDAVDRQVYGSLEGSAFTNADLEHVAASGEALARTATAEGDAAHVIPVRMGARVVGSLAMQGPALSAAVEDSIASLFAINNERVRALERAAASEIARRNEEFRSSLLDGLAHDLKTPLSAIRTCVTRLIDIPPRTEEVRQELLSIIDQESDRLEHSITEAIQLARIESRELHLSRESVDTAELIFSAIAGTRDEDPPRYSVETAPDHLSLDADRELVRRALIQILENARKYSPPGSPIAISARALDGEVTISIADRGPGIAQDELERVFQKFYRGRRGSAGVEGTGMGLAIAKGIIEAHGGRIRAENRVDGGAAISFTLPLRTLNRITE